MHRNGIKIYPHMIPSEPLTSVTKIGIVPPIIPEEGFGGMAGTYEEYRPGHWRVRLYFKGKRLEIFRDEAGKPLRAEFYAQKLLFYINGLLTQNKFIPDQWQKSSPFSMDSALDTWLENSTASEDTRAHYGYTIKKWIKPYWGRFDIRGVQRLHIPNFNAW